MDAAVTRRPLLKAGIAVVVLASAAGVTHVVAQSDAPVIIDGPFTLDCELEGANISCDGTLPTEDPTTVPSTTQAPTTTVPVTTTTQPATTTTVAPTTTAPPATTTTAPVTTTSTLPPTTSSTSPPTTTQPPSGVQFSEDFSTSAGFYQRFDFGLSLHNNEDTALQPNITHQWHGDHSMGCSPPDGPLNPGAYNYDASRYRDIEILPGLGPVTPAQVAAQNGKAQIFYHCAPNGPDTGHLMTSMYGEGYQIAWFSPKQTFTDVSRVCWDQNTTDMDAKWTNVQIVPMADVALVSQYKGFLDLGVDPPGFQPPASTRNGASIPASGAQGPTTDIWSPNGSGVKVESGGSVNYFEGDTFHQWNDSNWYDNNDKAARYRHCMTDNGNGTVTITAQRPDPCNLRRGGFQPCPPLTRTVDGAFPDGQVRVVFQDDMYDPVKREGNDPNQITWHWDNIEIR